MKPVKVYTTQYCHFCLRAKALLKDREIPFEEITVDGNAEKRAWLVETTGRRTVPQIFIGDEAIGGFTDLKALADDGDLEPKLDPTR